jgi:hypothetical protein
MIKVTNYVNKHYYLDKPGIYIYIAGICLLCWATGYITSFGYPITVDPSDTLLWSRICRLLPNKEVTYLAGFILMLGGGFLIYRMGYALVLIRERTFLPFLLYVLLLSTNPNFFPLKSTSIGVFCFIFSIYLLFASYHNQHAMGNIYKMALALSIGSLFWVHILWFFPLVWLGMYRFRILNGKTFMASLTGWATVYWLVFGWCVWQNDYSILTAPVNVLINIQPKLTYNDVRNGSMAEWVSLIYIFFFTVVSSLYVFVRGREDSVRTRQFLSFLMQLAILSFVLFFLYKESAVESLHFVCIPATILIARFIMENRSWLVFGIFHFTVLLSAVFLLIQLWNPL